MILLSLNNDKLTEKFFFEIWRMKQFFPTKLLSLYIYTYLPTPAHDQDTTLYQFINRSLTGLNSEISFFLTGCHFKVEVPSLPYYLHIAGRRIIRFIPFSMVLAPCKMPTVSPRIWTLVTVSFSHDGIHYTTNASSLFVGLSLSLSLSLFLSLYIYIYIPVGASL